jgi:hypothetical protein
MKKMFLVLGLVFLASSAFGSTTFTFDGFCDGMTINVGNTNTNVPPPQPKIFMGGTHNNYDCAGSVGIISGFKHGSTKTIPPYVTPVVDAADPLGGPSLSLQYLIQTSPSCVWANYYSVDGFNNNNYLTGTCTVGGAAPTGTKSTSPR